MSEPNIAGVPLPVTPLWQEASAPLDPDSPEYRFGKRLYDLHRDVAASIGCDEEEWIHLDPIDQWILGKSAIALIESLEDVEVVDNDFVPFKVTNTPDQVVSYTAPPVIDEEC